MREPIHITWRELTGNKFKTALHPGMLNDKGHVKTQAIRRIGDDCKSIFIVKYDREYVMQYLARMVCDRMFSMGKEKILELIGNAWDEKYPNATSKAITLPKNS